MARHEYLAHPELRGELARVHPGGAAEREQRETPRIMAALDGDDAQCARHRGVRDAHDPLSGGVDVHTEPPRDLRDRVVRAADVEPHATAEKRRRIEAPEHEVGVGHGRTGAAAVARRARIRPGAFRADAEHAAGVDSGKRAAARSDRVNVDDRQAHRHPVELPLATPRHVTVDQRDVRRRASHVEGEHAAHAGAARDADGAYDASGGPGEHRAHRLRRRAPRRDRAAVRLHDEKPCTAALYRREPCEVPRHQRRDVGVDDRGARPLVLARLTDERVRERDRHAEHAQRRSDRALVARRRIRVEQRDRDRLRPPRAYAAHQRAELPCRQRNRNPAVELDALAHRNPICTRDERRRTPRLEGIEFRARLAADLDDVLEPRRRDERDARTAALQQRVRRDCAAVGDPSRRAV